MITTLVVSLGVTLVCLCFWAAVDPWFALILDICVRMLGLEIRRFYMRVRLSYDIFIIKRSHKRYLRMADEILKERAAADEKSTGS